MSLVILELGSMPLLVSALPDQDPFPNITFKLFSQFITEEFSSKISLGTVLIVLFSLVENPELLNLHARQQHPTYPGEKKFTSTGWIKAMARAMEKRLGHDASKLFHRDERNEDLTDDTFTTGIGHKLDALAKLLDLDPYDGDGQFRGKLKEVSKVEIEPIYMICPDASECETMECNPCSLLQAVHDRDIPQVTLIRGTHIHDHGYALVGKCPDCQTNYYADHERAQDAEGSNQWSKVYLNSAKYLKVGQKTWVDRIFAGAVLNGMYSFHGSAAAYAEFWNDSFWSTQPGGLKRVSRRQIWHCFVQESVRSVAAASHYNLVLSEGLSIKEVTKGAFMTLGQNGVIRSAADHACDECTHVYKNTADVITGDDPAAIVGVDENRAVPVLLGDNADLAAQDAAQAQQHARDRGGGHDEPMDVDNVPSAFVTMVVLDGVVMGPTVSQISQIDVTILIILSSSIVHEMVVLMNWQMHEEDNIALNTKPSMELNVAFKTVTIKRLLGRKPVKSIKNSGTTMSLVMVVKAFWVFVDCCEEQMKRISPGSLV
jgi:hypothetical protein